MNEYYKDELLNIIETWTPEHLDVYIQTLENRIKDTKEQITTLRALRKRKMRNKNLKDTGARDGR